MVYELHIDKAVTKKILTILKFLKVYQLDLQKIYV